MKTTLLILTLLIASFSPKAQSKKYYQAKINYTLDCSSGTSKQSIIGSKHANYTTIKNSFKKWVYPHKIISFEITSLKQVARKDIVFKKEKFGCPIPINYSRLIPYQSNLIGCDTCLVSKYIGGSTTLGAPNYYPVMITITGLKFSVEAKPYFNKIDSLIVHVNKSQLTWLDDSTAIVHSTKEKFKN